MHRKQLSQILLVLLVAASLGALGMQSVVSGSPAREDQIRAAVAAWEEAFAAADVDRLMDLYAGDAISMPPGYAMLQGKDEIEADFVWLFDNFTFERNLTIVDIKMAGDLATRRAVWAQTMHPKDGSASITEVGKCVVVFEKRGNAWKIVWEVWNTDG